MKLLILLLLSAFLNALPIMFRRNSKQGKELSTTKTDYKIFTDNTLQFTSPYEIVKGTKTVLKSINAVWNGELWVPEFRNYNYFKEFVYFDEDIHMWMMTNKNIYGDIDIRKQDLFKFKSVKFLAVDQFTKQKKHKESISKEIGKAFLSDDKKLNEVFGSVPVVPSKPKPIDIKMFTNFEAIKRYMKESDPFLNLPLSPNSELQKVIKDSVPIQKEKFVLDGKDEIEKSKNIQQKTSVIKTDPNIQ